MAAFVESYTLTNLVIGLAFLASGTDRLADAQYRRAAPCWRWAVPSDIGGRDDDCGLRPRRGLADLPIRALSTFSNGPWQLGIGLLFPLALLLFPDGHLPSRRWMWVAWLIVLSGAFQAVTGYSPTGRRSATPQRPLDPLHRARAAGGGRPHRRDCQRCRVLLVIGALVWRFIRGDERTRRQVMWLILALLIILALNVERLLTGDGPILLLLGVLIRSRSRSPLCGTSCSTFA